MVGHENKLNQLDKKIQLCNEMVQKNKSDCLSMRQTRTIQKKKYS